MPYDYGSVMHYRTIAFSKDGQSPTIIPRNQAALGRMGQRIRFSRVDIAKLNRLYNCPINYYRGDDVVNKLSVIGSIKSSTLEENNELPETNGSELTANVISDSQKVYNFTKENLPLSTSNNNRESSSTEDLPNLQMPLSSVTVTSDNHETVKSTTNR